MASLEELKARALASHNEGVTVNPIHARRFLRSAKIGGVRIGQHAKKFGVRAAPRVRKFASVSTHKTRSGATSFRARTLYGLSQRQHQTWRRLNDKLDDGQPLTESERTAYRRLRERVRTHRGRIRTAFRAAKRLTA